MAKVINASIPDNLLPTWEMLVAEYDGPSAFLQALLKAAKRYVETGAIDMTSSSLYMMALEEKVAALESQRRAVDASIVAVRETIVRLGSPAANKEGKAAPVRRAQTPEEYVSFWGPSLTQRRPDELAIIAKNRGWDPEDFARRVDALRAAEGGVST